MGKIIIGTSTKKKSYLEYAMTVHIQTCPIVSAK